RLPRCAHRKPIVKVLVTHPLLREERPSNKQHAGCSNYSHDAHEQLLPPSDPTDGRIMTKKYRRNNLPLMSCDWLTTLQASVYYIVGRHSYCPGGFRYAIVPISSNGHRPDGGDLSDDSGSHRSRDRDVPNRSSRIWRTQSSNNVVVQIADNV